MEMEQKGICKKCGAEIIIYDEYTGFLPSEESTERYANHHWKACELHQEIRELKKNIKDYLNGKINLSTFSIICSNL